MTFHHASSITVGTGNEDTARKMVKALKCGSVPDAEDIRSRQKARAPLRQARRDPCAAWCGSRDHGP